MTHLLLRFDVYAGWCALSIHDSYEEAYIDGFSYFGEHDKGWKVVPA